MDGGEALKQRRTILKTHLSVVIRDQSVKKFTMFPPTGVMDGPGGRKHSLLGRLFTGTTWLLMLLLVLASSPRRSPLTIGLPLLLFLPALWGLNPL